MKGLEGDADINSDNKITAGELHSFVQDKVERQSGFKQTPDLQGDADKSNSTVLNHEVIKFSVSCIPKSYDVNIRMQFLNLV